MRHFFLFRVERELIWLSGVELGAEGHVQALRGWNMTASVPSLVVDARESVLPVTGASVVVLESVVELTALTLRSGSNVEASKLEELDGFILRLSLFLRLEFSSPSALPLVRFKFSSSASPDSSHLRRVVRSLGHLSSSPPLLPQPEYSPYGSSYVLPSPHHRLRRSPQAQLARPPRPLPLRDPHQGPSPLPPPA